MSERRHPFDLSADAQAILQRVGFMNSLLDLITAEAGAIAADAERLADRLETLSAEPEAVSAAKHLREMTRLVRAQSTKLEGVRTLQ